MSLITSLLSVISLNSIIWSLLFVTTHGQDFDCTPKEHSVKKCTIPKSKHQYFLYITPQLFADENFLTTCIGGCGHVRKATLHFQMEHEEIGVKKEGKTVDNQWKYDNTSVLAHMCSSEIGKITAKKLTPFLTKKIHSLSLIFHPNCAPKVSIHLLNELAAKNRITVYQLEIASKKDLIHWYPEELAGPAMFQKRPEFKSLKLYNVSIDWDLFGPGNQTKSINELRNYIHTAVIAFHPSIQTISVHLFNNLCDFSQVCKRGHLTGFYGKPVTTEFVCPKTCNGRANLMDRRKRIQLKDIFKKESNFQEGDPYLFACETLDPPHIEDTFVHEICHNMSLYRPIRPVKTESGIVWIVVLLTLLPIILLLLLLLTLFYRKIKVGEQFDDEIDVTAGTPNKSN